MANRYWVGGTATWDGTAGTKWSTTSGGASGAAVPTVADDVFFDAASGAAVVTLSSSSTGRSINCTGFTGELIHPAATTISLGDATAGASNIALKFVSGMTYTLGNAATSALSFISFSTTQQTIDFGSKTAGNITVNGSGSNYAITTAITMDATATFTSTAGSIHFDGAADNSGLHHYIGKFVSTSSTARTLTFGTATFEIIGLGVVWNMGTSANISLSALSSTISFTAENPSSTAMTMTWGGSNKLYGTVTMAGPGGLNIGDGYFVNVSILGPYRAATNQVNVGIVSSKTAKITGTFQVHGDDAAHVAIFWPDNNAVPGTVDITGATLDFAYCSFQDCSFVTGGADLDLSSITGGSGDCGGNTLDGGILTFTAPTTQHWLTPTGGSTSDVNNWTSRIPLPQDTCIFDTAFTGSPTITIDTPWSLGNIDFSGGSGNVSFVADISTTNIFLPFKGRSGVTLGTNATKQLYLNSRADNHTFEFNSTTFSASTVISSGNGGKITFVDSGSVGTAGAVSHRSGTIVIPSGVIISMSSYSCTATSSNDLYKSQIHIYGMLSLYGTSTIFSMTGSGTTNSVPLLGGIIRISNTSASSKTFAGKGNTYPDIYILGGGAGAVIFTGSNTFNRIYTDGGGTKSITLPGSGTTTLLSGLGLANGTNVITFTSSSGSTNLEKGTDAIVWDYVNLTNIVATGSGVHYAGSHSTDGTGNTNWLFSDPPTGYIATETLTDRLNRFYTTKTGIGHRGDAERAFWGDDPYSNL